jgi:hypothetical protein
MMALKTRSMAALVATVAAVGGMSVATPPASAAGKLNTVFKNWVVSGSLTPKKLNEPVTLPAGSTFNGAAHLEVEYFSKTKTYGITGTATGSIFVPPFKASLKLLGLVPTTVGVSFTQVGNAEGTVVSAPKESDCRGEACLVLKVITKADVGITAVGTNLGLGELANLEGSISTNCQTSEPVAFNLSDTLDLAELAEQGPRFKGTVTIPSITCEGPEALVLAPILTAVMSGPENPYALGISPH